MHSTRATYSGRAMGRRRNRKPSRMICFPLLFVLLSAVIVSLAYSRQNIFALNNSDGDSDSNNGNPLNSPDLTESNSWENGLTGGGGEGYFGSGLMGFFEQTQSVWASDVLGSDKELFEPGDSMYASVPAVGQTVTFYVTAHHAAWVDGDALADVSGGAEMLTLNPGGVQTVLVWVPLLVSGSYDVVLDANNNGVFDLGLDSTDVANVRLANVIPEVPLGTVVASVSMVAGAAGFVVFKRSMLKRQL